MPFQPTSHLYLPEELPLMETNHTFASGSVWLKMNMDKQIATFDLFVRDMPPNRNFLLFGGLEEIIQDLQNWKFTPEQIEYLDRIGVISAEMKSYLENYKFRGTLWAMPEGTVFFPGEPILRLTAPIIEANLFTLYFMNVVTSHTLFLSKAIRSVLAAPGKTILGGSCRAQSIETNAKAVRALYLAGGGVPSSTAAICYKYGIAQEAAPTFFGQHAFIKSFEHEADAMRAFAEVFPDQTAFMIDTYDTNNGLEKAITVGKELLENGHKLRFVVIDSGDLDALSKQARKRLDEEGLGFVQIIVASNIDEYKLKELMDAGTPADVFVVITELNTSSDAPKLEIVYKMAQLQDGDHVKYTAKLTPGKMSLPGVKQVYRTLIDGVMRKDVIDLENEQLGHPLMLEIFRDGVLTYETPDLEVTREYISHQVAQLPNDLRDILSRYEYEVAISDGVNKLMAEVRRQHT